MLQVHKLSASELSRPWLSPVAGPPSISCCVMLTWWHRAQCAFAFTQLILIDVCFAFCLITSSRYSMFHWQLFSLEGLVEAVRDAKQSYSWPRWSVVKAKFTNDSDIRYVNLWNSKWIGSSLTTSMYRYAQMCTSWNWYKHSLQGKYWMICVHA